MYVFVLETGIYISSWAVSASQRIAFLDCSQARKLRLFNGCSFCNAATFIGFSPINTHVCDTLISDCSIVLDDSVAAFNLFWLDTCVTHNLIFV